MEDRIERQGELARRIAWDLGLNPPTHTGLGLYCVTQTITPQQAQMIMDRYHIGNNRSQAKNNISRIVADITRDAWDLTAATIAFNDDGMFYEGQHRLTACIKANKPIETIVVFGVPRESMPSTDIGKSRNCRDAMAISGGPSIKTSEYGAVKTAVTGCRPYRHIGANVEKDLALAMFDSVLFIRDNLGWQTRRVSISSVMGAIVRAYYMYPGDLNKLAEFCRLLKTGEFRVGEVPGHKTVHRFREALMKRKTAVGAEETLNVYLQTSFVAQRFIEGRDTSRINPVSRGNEIPLSRQLEEIVRRVDPGLLN